MSHTIRELAARLDAQVKGDGSLQLRGVASARTATSHDLVFAEDDETLAEALTSAAGAVIAGKAAAGRGTTKPLLLVEHPRLAFARAEQILRPAVGEAPGVDATAVVAPSAKLRAKVRIEERAVVRENAIIGEGTMIGAGTFVGAGVVLGKDCRIYSNVALYPGTAIGNRVTVHAGAVLGSDGFGYVRDAKSGEYVKFPQIGTLTIGDDVEIGANSTVDRGALEATTIGAGTKIDNLVHIGHNAQIGRQVVIAAQTGVSGSSVIQDGVIVGGQVGIADHVRIEAGAILGAQSGIPSKKVIRGRGVVFWGTPARPIKEYLKELAALSRLAKKK